MTLTIQFYTLLAMIGMGSGFGAALDTYSRFLNRSERKRWIVFIHDFLFWIIQGLLIFYVLFLVNEGEFRLYLFLALLCGFSAYQALFKGFYQRFLEFLIILVIKLARFIANSVHMLIFLPIKWVIVSILAIIIGIGKFVLTLLKWAGKILLFILNIFWRPLKWILTYIWNLLPVFVTKNVGKFYNKGKGILLKIKNSIFRTLNGWKNKKK
ncbi:spore cortex biosynthesis protein YabQ [Peribacillus castrilensis]|uniref:Spore cortex biosynthesis protein YabQ n=1 Tax=Peribacillus simplex TaxID=1478 RepID=A0AAN2PB79_9BACI|nr:MULTISPECIES: spore cortex biosynthesis protein YabQ [Bacillaceae]MCP1096373.1 spore cortex biosynthesis protein YabQ [Bacillaceae bacterium OS4b]QYF83060.1 spore cortex biosynthesis protein YabQ [Brevibacterium sp. PAMC21349]MBD8589624.1 spore cortex biosynthesis protein YabQ [Peribacillus simplex]MBX9954993.1 spore cortex biosynthesis protein YabQ [Peribacillus simplex]MCF7620187.1 spore cortex biosynthesis protein YabQ [Peribacillus frigoritolerans]